MSAAIVTSPSSSRDLDVPVAKQAAPVGRGIAGQAQRRAAAVPAAFMPNRDILTLPPRFAMDRPLFVRPDDLLDQPVADDIAPGQPHVGDPLDAVQPSRWRRAVRWSRLEARSDWVVSPVTTMREPFPRRVKNIFICVTVVFWPSSRMMKVLLRVRPRMKASGTISTTSALHVPFDLLEIEHFVHGVQQGRRNGLTFASRSPGQKTEPFARFDRRPHQHDLS